MLQTDVSKSHSPLVEGALFLLVGIGSTLSNLAIYAGLLHFVGLSPLLSASLAYALLLPVHFAAYARLVFQSETIDWRVIAGYLSTLLTSFLLNVGLVRLYWGTLQADPIAAQVLALIPAIATSYLLFKYVVFADTKPKWRFNLSFIDLLPILTALAAIVASYLSIVVMLLFSHQILWADDWRIYNDYFFVRDLWGSIVDRQNGHLFIVPNTLFLANYAGLGGGMTLLSILNAGLLCLIGFVLGAVVDSALRDLNVTTSNRIASFTTVAAASLMLAAPVTQIWAIGVHNQLVVFGAVLASVFSAGLLGALERLRIAAGFASSALLASASFSTGSAVWALGFAGAFAKRERLSVIATYFAGGAIAGIVTLGVFSGVANRAHVGDPLKLLAFVPPFLGNMPSRFIYGPRVDEAHLILAGIAGTIGLVAYLTLTARVFGRFAGRGNTALDQVYTALWLFAGFAVLTGILVAIGRSSGSLGIELAIAPRFLTWSAAFWVALSATAIIVAHEVSTSRSLVFLLPVAVVALLSAVTIAVNVTTVQKLQYVANKMIGRALQIAISGAERPPRDYVWSKNNKVRDATVIKVINHLRDHERNIFRNDWAQLYGTNASEHIASAGISRCRGEFQIQATKRKDEWKILGAAWPNDRRMWTLSLVIAVEPEGNIVGIALPAFGSPSVIDQRRWTLSGLVYFVPLVRKWPGASGRVIGELRAPPSQQPPKAGGYTWAGRDRTGRWCQIGK